MIETIEFEYQGKKVHLKVNDPSIADEMMVHKTFYEHWLLEYMQNFKGGTWIDIGANVGNHAYYFATFCKADYVIAIEPLPESYDLLVENMAACVGLNYDTLKIAISDRPGHGTLIRLDSRLGSTRMADKWEINGAPCHTNTMDFLLQDTVDIRVIKIDVEGHELHVLRGGMKVIARHKPELFIETWDKLDIIEDMLKPLGYEMKERYCHAPVYHFSTDKSIKRTYNKPQ